MYNTLLGTVVLTGMSQAGNKINVIVFSAMHIYPTVWYSKYCACMQIKHTTMKRHSKMALILIDGERLL